MLLSRSRMDALDGANDRARINARCYRSFLGGGAREMVGHICRTASALDCRTDWREQQGLSNDRRSHASIGGGFVAFENGEGCGLLVTASRRTGAANLAILREELSLPGIYFWDGSGENPYHAFLAAADAFLVSVDSVNMVFEACFTGKPVYVLPLALRGRQQLNCSTTR